MSAEIWPRGTLTLENKNENHRWVSKKGETPSMFISRILRDSERGGANIWGYLKSEMETDGEIGVVMETIKRDGLKFGAWFLEIRPGGNGVYELVAHAKRAPRQSVAINQVGTLKVENMPALISATNISDISDADLMPYIDALAEAFNKATAELCRRADIEANRGD